MKIKMKVVLETPDGEKSDEVTADARSVRAYESEFGVSFITSELSMIQLTQLAYVAMKRAKTFAGSYDVFDEQCVEVEAADEDVAESPKSTAKVPGGVRSRA